MHKILVVFFGLVIGILIGYLLLPQKLPLISSVFRPHKQVVGFLPYGLLSRADKDYSQYITTLAYFGLTVDTDGSILKLNNPQEEEPGWHALQSGRLDSIFANMTKSGVKLSLVIFNADDKIIYSLIDQPMPHAKTLISQLAPIMKKYNFTDLNLDIESFKEASEEARIKFTEFFQEVKNGLDENRLGTLTVDISPTAFVKKYLIDPKSINTAADYILVMGYDYHYPGSIVSGPVAPLYGAGTVSELDIDIPMREALKIIPKHKLILGLPLYGYTWETVTDFPRSATIPASALTYSNRLAEQLLRSCATCSAQRDEEAKESYLIYQDQETGTFHQIFYPDQKSMMAKVDYAKSSDIGGIGLWALGYEGSTILDPLVQYK